MGRSLSDEAGSGTEMCLNCGAMYHVEICERSVPTRDWYNCAICGRLLKEWDSFRSPRFTLLGPGPGYPPRKAR